MQRQRAREVPNFQSVWAPAQVTPSAWRSFWSAPALCAFRLVRSKCCLIDRMLRGYPERNPWRATASRSLSRQFIAHANRDVVRKHDERISPYGDVASVFVVKKLLA